MVLQINSQDPSDPDHSITSPKNMATPNVSTQKSQETLFMQKFGLTASEMARAKSLRQLGVSEEDLLIAEKLLREMPAPPVKGRSNSKAELVLGYDKARLDRKKAMDVLGITEETLDSENTKNLGALGIDGRRRSKDSVFGANGRSFRSQSEPPRKRSSFTFSLPSRRSSNNNGDGIPRPLSERDAVNRMNRGGSWFSNILRKSPTNAARRLSMPTRISFSRSNSPRSSIKFGFDCTKSFGEVDENNSSPEYVAAMLRQKTNLDRRKIEALEKENRDLRQKVELMEKENKVLELEKTIVELENLQKEEAGGKPVGEEIKQGNLKDDTAGGEFSTPTCDSPDDAEAPSSLMPPPPPSTPSTSS